MDTSTRYASAYDGERNKQHKANNVTRHDDDDHSEEAKAIKAALAKINNEVTDFCKANQGVVNEVRENVHDLMQRMAKAERNATFESVPACFDGRPILESEGFERFKSGREGTSGHLPLGLSVKALTNPSGNSPGYSYPTPADRLPGSIGPPARRLSFLDAVGYRPVFSNVFEFVQLNHTGEADVQVEGEEKAEVNYDGTLVTTNIATIAAHTTLSAQVRDDNTGLIADLSRFLGQQVAAKVEQELLVGSGISPHANGLYTQAVPITTTQAGTPDRIGEAITEMDVEGYTANLILLHPRDWRRITLMKNAEGDYQFGNPAAPVQPYLWNMPVVTTPSLPEGTALVGDSRMVQILDRMHPTVFLSQDHKDYRTRNLVLVLVEARAGLALYDRLAFRRVSLAAMS